MSGSECYGLAAGAAALAAILGLIGGMVLMSAAHRDGWDRGGE